MKLRIDFGLSGPRELVSWWGALMDFPKRLEYNNKKWEWVMYDTDPLKSVDYILNFVEIPSYDAYYSEPVTKFEEIKKNNYGPKCECGAIYSSFSWDHMRYCSKHKPWGHL